MFARSHLAADGPVDLTLRELQSTDMTCLEARDTPNCRTAHLRAVLSFATVFFGTKHHHPGITQQGFISHGATLQQLNRALLEPKCHEFDEVIVSVTTLAIQETLVPSGPNHFLNHMLGLEKLLALRDPRSNCSQRTADLYKCLRHMLLYAALGAGRPCILAKPEWKALLRQYCATEEERHEQLLYDFVADCTVLASERDKVLKSDNQDGNAIERIRHAAQELCEHLGLWRRQWGTNPKNAYVEMPALSSPSTAPTDLVFLNTTSALTPMLYNIALINFVKILMSLPRSPQQRMSHEQLEAVARSAVLDICRCMPSPSNEAFGKKLHASPVLHWAVQTTRFALEGDDSAEAKWLGEMLERKSIGMLAGGGDGG
jgi:hypothetical protein